MFFPKQDQPCKILIGIDGSEHSLAAAILLCDLPLPVDTHIIALGVFSPREASNYHSLIQPIEQIKGWLEKKGCQVKTELLAGSPAEVLVNYANEYQPDLIVLGAKGLRNTLGILLGGVAQQVLEYASLPVMIVRAPYSRLKRALLAIDGSPCSQVAEKFLGCFPFPTGTHLTVIHILPPIISIEPSLVPHSWRTGLDGSGIFKSEELLEPIGYTNEEERLGQALLDKAIERLTNLLPTISPEITIDSHLTRGDAAIEIIDFAHQNQVDLIITGSRGLSQMRSWLLGSVSRKIVHYSHCSVLVVRCKQKKTGLQEQER